MYTCIFLAVISAPAKVPAWRFREDIEQVASCLCPVCRLFCHSDAPAVTFFRPDKRRGQTERLCYVMTVCSAGKQRSEDILSVFDAYYWTLVNALPDYQVEYHNERSKQEHTESPCSLE